MLGELNSEMLEYLLKNELLGRIGCHADGATYIVPVHYVYEDPFIYAHSAKGMKVNLMQKNPEVCFEVERITDFFNWETVICWGTFEVITDFADQQKAMQKIIDRIEPYLAKAENAHPSHGVANNAYDIGTVKQLVLYRIKLHKKTGRFEQREGPQQLTQER